MTQKLLHDFLIEEHIKSALKEDIGFGDITTDFLYSEEDVLTAYLNTRCSAVVCGLNVFKKVFSILSDKVTVDFLCSDGDFVKAGTTLAKVCGNARAILTGERTALNYIQRMSGIATETKRYQDAIGEYRAFVTDTRKNTRSYDRRC